MASWNWPSGLPVSVPTLAPPRFLFQGDAAWWCQESVRFHGFWASSHAQAPDLRLGRLLLVCNPPERIHQCLVRFFGASAVRSAERCCGSQFLSNSVCVGDCSRQEALTQRAERDEPDTEFPPKVGRISFLRLSPPTANNSLWSGRGPAAQA